MRYAISLVAFAGALNIGSLAAQPVPASAGATDVLATVRITHSVLAILGGNRGQVVAALSREVPAAQAKEP